MKKRDGQQIEIDFEVHYLVQELIGSFIYLAGLLGMNRIC